MQRASFQDTRPAALDATGSVDPWAPFRVEHPQEQLRLLRQLRDDNVPVVINSPEGLALSTSLWAVDSAQSRLSFNADTPLPLLDAMVEGDEAVAVAYLESVKLQFDLQGLVLVRGTQGSTLQTRMPREIYRFQRRNAYRVRTHGRPDPVALLRHPSIPDMQLALRVLDVSIGGCALWLPGDVPLLQTGTRIGEMLLDLDADTRFHASVVLQHVSAIGVGERSDRGVRLGCEWQRLGGAAQRTLQRWIDGAQKRRRLLSLD
jgi:c-di-GMP-binding flagellar brake protein YcgR